MIYEIERKWVVKPYADWSAASGYHYELTAGYLSVDPEVRIRKKVHEGPMTLVTHTLGLKLGSGLVRPEFEFDVSEQEALELWQHTHGSVRKTRWGFGRFEVDQYHGKLSGLYTMECELTTVDEPTPEWPASITDVLEVTGDPTYANSGLASLDAIAALALVRESYRS